MRFEAFMAVKFYVIVFRVTARWSLATGYQIPDENGKSNFTYQTSMAS